MSDDNLPAEVGIPDDSELHQISERLQEMNQTIQEQAFLLGFRNGFREGEMLEEFVHLAEEQAATAPSEEERDAWREVRWYLNSVGAYQDDEGEITYPPGLNLYVGASDCRPHIQVAGERVNVTGFHFDWLPNAQDPEVEAIEPQDEQAIIEIEAHLELPEDSEQREELMQWIQGLHDGD